ncbi:MAG: preprotein translocase subunit SecA [Gammaproteobacteria bacterium]|nr:preprotein translocase subunit SecA [Gammaproteobacteria bacterium]
MFRSLLTRLVGSRNDRKVKQYFRTVTRINALEPDTSALSDGELRARTQQFRQRFQDGEDLDALLPEAFAVVREAARRTLGMRHFDVQMIGGLALHNGMIAEMRTGEGKTLVATLAAYLNAIPGKGVHVVTVNDYLARRDAAWMGQVYEFLGLTTGVIVPDLEPDARREAYAADITYGTNNEFGFDYLRDNMAFSMESRVQRGQTFAIIDEVDSILIDEARTPLIISGPTEGDPETYVKIDQIVPGLSRQPAPEEGQDADAPELPGDYSVDEKARQVLLTEAGHSHIETLLEDVGLLEEGASLYDAANITLMHHVHAALRAHVLFKRDVDYVVKNNEIIIVDEFTGRLMTGRRWSEGLHQAVEAKEGVEIKRENQTLASITFQNYFRLYPKLSGMTGTADTEAYEFQTIYGLEVLVIPTNQEMTRDDAGDLIYLTTEEKFQAILEDVRERHAKGQPVLVGTASIQTSEQLAALLQKAGLKHQVLNAKFHEKEAEIIAQAGQPEAITIATNMAGRGTDIVLGGNLEAELTGAGETSESRSAQIRQAWQQRHDQVVELGGLHVIGTERNESRRVDNQLRGRAGRQGDPGSSRFYLSLEDDLMRIFASERMAGLMQKLGLRDGEAIEHPWVSKAIANAQRKVEGRNFDMRKQLLEYDDVANEQRKVVYKQRDILMEADNVSDTVATMRADVMGSTVDRFVPRNSLDEQWDIKGLTDTLAGEFDLHQPIQRWIDEDDDLHAESLRQKVIDAADQVYAEKSRQVPDEVIRHFEKAIMMQSLDTHWKEHLAQMDHLRQSIHLRSYAQKNPKQEYKREAFELLEQMLEQIKSDVVSTLMQVKVREEEDVAAVETQRQAEQPMEFQHPDATSAVADTPPTPGAPPADPRHSPAAAPYVRSGQKVGRNDPCPCGSGRKYKQCHGKLS